MMLTFKKSLTVFKTVTNFEPFVAINDEESSEYQAAFTEEADELLEENNSLNLETNKNPSASVEISDTPSTSFQSNALVTDLKLTLSLDKAFQLSLEINDNLDARVKPESTKVCITTP